MAERQSTKKVSPLPESYANVRPAYFTASSPLPPKCQILLPLKSDTLYRGLNIEFQWLFMSVFLKQWRVGHQLHGLHTMYKNSTFVLSSKYISFITSSTRTSTLSRYHEACNAKSKRDNIILETRSNFCCHC